MSDNSTEDESIASPAATTFSLFVVSASLIPFGLLALTLLARYLFLAELIGNFRLQLLVILLPFPILLGLLGRWKWGLVLGGLAFYTALSVGWVYLPVTQPAAGPEKLKIMSFNVLGHNHEHRRVSKRIRDEDPDVLTILEYSNHWTDVFSKLKKKYPYQILEPRWHGFGIAMFSKYPFSDSEVRFLTEESTDIPSIVAEVELGDQKLRLAALHVLSPTNVFRMRLRNAQFEELSDVLIQKEVPTVVMGDFNCTPWSPFLSDFMSKTGYRDSRNGFGFHASWHAKIWPLMIPIDHALVSPQVHVHQRYLCREAGSDHLPLVFEVSVGE